MAADVAVNERRLPRWYHVFERLSHPCDIARQLLPQPHGVAECQQRRPIVTSEPRKQRVPGAEQMLQPLSSHAFADVESENHIERDLLEPNEVHFLQDAFVPAPRNPVARGLARSDRDP